MKYVNYKDVEGMSKAANQSPQAIILVNEPQINASDRINLRKWAPEKKQNLSQFEKKWLCSLGIF